MWAGFFRSVQRLHRNTLRKLLNDQGVRQSWPDLTQRPEGKGGGDPRHIRKRQASELRMDKPGHHGVARSDRAAHLPHRGNGKQSLIRSDEQCASFSHRYHPKRSPTLIQAPHRGYDIVKGVKLPSGEPLQFFQIGFDYIGTGLNRMSKGITTGIEIDPRALPLQCGNENRGRAWLGRLRAGYLQLRNA